MNGFRTRGKVRVGERYGNLTVLSESGRSKAGAILWKCICDCGNETVAVSTTLIKGKKKSCGCLKINGKNKVDEIGKRHGRLVVLSRHDTGTKAAHWLCQCDCGNKTVVPGYALRRKRGGTKSCGCLQKEAARRNWVKPKGKSAVRQIWGYYRRRARKYNLRWGLTLEEFEKITSQNCHYCGIPPSTYHTPRNTNGGYLYNGIDRIDSEGGYVHGNIVPCCSTCNYAKRDMGIDQFREWVSRIYSHMIGGAG